MKRGWLGVGLLAVFLLAGMVISAVMSDAHMPTQDLLQQAADATLSGDFDRGVQIGMEAKDRWEQQWNGTAIVADHSPMDDIDALFAEMEIYAKTGEEPHFAACCRELAQRLQAMAEAHKFSWWNVL